MIRADQIPDEVVEAAAKAMWRTDDPTAWERMMAATAIFAALDAWPGALQFKPLKPGAVMPLSCLTLTLPLPQEVSDE